MRSVVVVPHDPEWARKFDSEAEILQSTLGSVVSAIHHIGSTSIPGIHAKPIVDMLLEVPSIEALDGQAAALVAEGYEAMGEFGIPGRRYFRKDNASGVREYHVHAFARGSEGAVRHLAFRDYLRSHPTIAQEYSELKRRLARRFPSDIAAYMDGKDPFIKPTEQAALVWWRSARR
jgi:GrpB-like predicted nucleotidyltransferase (UPF0157 family)